MSTRFLALVALVSLPVLAPAVAATADAPPADAALEAYRQSDFATALERWTERAEGGSGTAQYNVGMLHSQGKGVPQDHEQAAAWYLKAAETGYTRAQYELAVLLESGEHVEQDLVSAHLWFSFAADRRYEDARKSRKRVGKLLDDRQIAESEMRARHLRQSWKESRRGTSSSGD